jgi:predicted amidohydrolase
VPSELLRGCYAGAVVWNDADMSVIGAVLAQIPVAWSVGENCAAIMAALDTAQPGDVVVTPEGSLTGYPTDGDVEQLSFLDEGEVAEALDRLETAAAEVGASLWVGVLSKDSGRWVNEAIELSADVRRVYRKRNLAHVERPLFAAGVDLPVFPTGQTQVGVQLCRELRFPEQWIWLARGGAEIFVHPNNGVAPRSVFEVWRSMLVARAHETQRFVVSANASRDDQHCPSVVVAPSGVVLVELPAGVTEVIRMELDLTQVSDGYLRQRIDT